MKTAQLVLLFVGLSVAQAVGAVPAAPTNFSGTPVSTSSVKLTWKDNATNESKYKVQIALGSGAFSLLTALPADSTAFLVTKLKTNTLYRFRVVAVNSSGKAASNIISVRTLPLKPAAPSSVGAQATSIDSITVRWKDNSGNEAKFEVEKATATGAFALAGVVDANVTSFEATGLGAGKLYRFRVRARNRGGLSAYSNIAEDTTHTTVPVPAPPSNLVVQPYFANEPENEYLLGLDWEDNSDDETGFEIQSSTDGQTFATIGTVDANTHSADDIKLPQNTFFWYRVRAITGETGKSEWSNVASAATRAVQAPTAPIDLVGKVVSDKEILLTWTNTSPNEGYDVETVVNGQTFVNRIPEANVIGVPATGLKAGTPYSFRVRAANGIGVSAYTAQVTATTTGDQEVVTATRFVNNTVYPIVSLIINGVEQFPTAPASIPPGAAVQINLPAAKGYTYRATNGSWSGGTRNEMYVFPGQFDQVAGNVGTVTIHNPTIQQLLTRFSSSGSWVGDYWQNTTINYKGFRFFSNGTYVLYNNGQQVGSGTYSEVSYPGNYMVKFYVDSGFEGTYYENSGVFYMRNGSSDWPIIQYSPAGP